MLWLLTLSCLSSDPFGGIVVPTVWRPAAPHSREHQRPRHVRPQALRQDQPREGQLRTQHSYTLDCFQAFALKSRQTEALLTSFALQEKPPWSVSGLWDVADPSDQSKMSVF